jgi:cysteinyl-tRNA synthetase
MEPPVTRSWNIALVEYALMASVATAAPGMAGERRAAGITLADAKQRLADVRAWGCQFQNLDVAKAAESPLDLIVIDPDATDGHGRALDASDVATLKRKPDGQSRLVFSYLSVGEAENYRRYWRDGWRVEPPEWLGPTNPNWPGSFVVRYWQDPWKELLFGSPDAALDRILALGFDGVFLDRVDAYGDWVKGRPSAPLEMVELVDDLVRYARKGKGDFLVIGQNSEELLRNSSYIKSIDAVSKESLLYGLAAPGQANMPSDVDWSLRRLKQAKGQGLPILAIEYLDDTATISAARMELDKLGFVPFFANRELDRLP